jgi:hypothetical protein
MSDCDVSPERGVRVTLVAEERTDCWGVTNDAGLGSSICNVERSSGSSDHASRLFLLLYSIGLSPVVFRKLV